MRGLTLIGTVVVLLGVVALLVGHFSYSETKPVITAGPIQINAQEEHRIAIPTIAGIVVVLAGVGLIIAGRRAA